MADYIRKCRQLVRQPRTGTSLSALPTHAQPLQAHPIFLDSSGQRGCQQWVSVAQVWTQRNLALNPSLASL